MSESNSDPYADEAKQRWGQTTQYQESARRLASYTPDQMASAYTAQTDATQAVIDAKRAGHGPESDEAIAAAELCRLAINDWFYPCDRTMHAELGQMYVTDQRFSDHYEQLEPGLAEYLRDAILANVHREQ
jgi:hypothetical protein